MSKQYSPKVSVIVPAYNVEDYIEDTIMSILAQTLSDIEVIVIDDGSTDGTFNVLNRIKNKDSRVRVATRPNTGVSGARNDGLDMASAEYVCFVDSDDLITSNMLEVMYKALKKSDAQLCVASIKSFTDAMDLPVFSSEGKSSVIDTTDGLRRLLFEKGILNSQCSKLYKRDYLGSQKFDTNIAYGEDMLFNYNFMQKDGGHLVLLDFTPYYYRQRAGSAMATPYQKKRADSLRAAKIIYGQLVNNKLYRDAAINKLFTESVSILGLMAGGDYDYGIEKECLEFISKNKIKVLVNSYTGKKNRIFALLAIANPRIPGKLVKYRNKLRNKGRS